MSDEHEMMTLCNGTVFGDFEHADRVWNMFLYHISQIGGTTVLSTMKHNFVGGAFVGFVALGTGYATIRTFPDSGRAFVEMASYSSIDNLDDILLFTIRKNHAPFGGRGRV